MFVETHVFALNETLENGVVVVPLLALLLASRVRTKARYLGLVYAGLSKNNHERLFVYVFLDAYSILSLQILLWLILFIV